MKTRPLKLAAALGLWLAVLPAAESGDILRGGSPMGSTTSGASYGTSSAATAQARARSQDTLARTTQAIQSVQAMQTAARNLARTAPNQLGPQLPKVPNGLVLGGLVPDSGLISNGVAKATTSWQNALTPVQSISKGQTAVTIKQTAQQALLNWQTFNLGKETTIHFDQQAGGSEQSKWIAFNKINDPSGVPSQILGSMSAEGQVYLINQNGILFGGSSQINLHALVASSLPINDNLVNRGLLNNPDDQFLFSSLALASGAATPTFNPPPQPNTSTGRNGDVVVQPGALLSSPTTADHVGGKIALIGPNVSNAGTISTPDGQTILAAGNQVAFAAHTTSDPSLRGLDVYVGSVDVNSGSVTNSGLINAPRANVTLAGKSVNQLGVVAGSTSVALNGRIDLLASYNAASSGGLPNLPPFLPRLTGTVTLGAGSVTQILPELMSEDRVVGSQLALPSVVNIQGLAIHLASNATLLAPGANAPRDSTGSLIGKDENGLTLTDGVTMNAGIWNYFISGGTPVDTFVSSSGQIYLDSGATINVAGSTDVSAPISENIVSVQLRGAELADSLLQRFGTLRGQTIQIDVRQEGKYNGTSWIGTPLADASGYANLIERPVGELTIDGGTVRLNAGDSVVLQGNASIDVSGGWINYQGGLVNTTRVLSGGQILDISQATPDRVYDGIYTGQFTASHLKYGLTETFTNPLLSNAHYEPGYLFGGNGGDLTITAPSLALDGHLLGTTAAGPRQRTASPDLSGLSVNFQAQSLAAAAQNLFPFYSPRPPKVIFDYDSSLLPAAPFALDSMGNPLPLRADRQAEVTLSPDLVLADGFGKLNIENSDGSITVPSHVALTASPQSSFTWNAANIDVEGKVHAAGGSLNFTVYDLSPFQSPTQPLTETPPPDPTRGHFTLGATASLSTAGLIVDDRIFAAAPNSLPIVTDGGEITVKSYSANLAAGSQIDVSGGITVSANGKQAFGNGGSIAILTGQDPNITSLLGGRLQLDTTLKGYGGVKGGSLALLASVIQIGGTKTNDDTLLLSPDFFNAGGFTDFTLKGLGGTTGQVDQYVPGIIIATNTVIRPSALSWLASPEIHSDFKLTPLLQPEGVRTPVNLSFVAAGVTDPFNLSNPLLIRGDVIMEGGASITTDARSNISFSGQTVALLGTVTTPSGFITISGSQNSRNIFTSSDAVPTVDLGPHSLLSTAGITLFVPDARGFRTGTILPGGTITVAGNIVAEAGALLDVSGATGVLDLSPGLSILDQSPNSGGGIAPASSGSLTGGVSVLPSYDYNGVSVPINGSLIGNLLIPTPVDSDGGSIILKGGQELFSDATLRGAAGGANATGGSLSISSGRADGLQTALDVTLLVKQSGNSIAKPFYREGQTAIGHPVLDAQGATVPGLGYFSVNRFREGDFTSLTLKGTVQFSGPTTIQAGRTLAIADGGVLFADSSVHLTSPHVILGTSFQAPLDPQQQPISIFQQGSDPLYFLPTYGAGSLTVTADLIDLGNLSLQNIGKADFIADHGDIRGDGTLDVSGDISMRAGQIYPPTAVSFTIAAYDHNGVAGSVTFAASGDRPLPLSAGGELNVYGSIIHQGGMLRAPIGTINLGWDGSGSSPKDLITGAGLPAVSTGQSSAVAVTQRLTLSKGSLTSVSALDPTTGQELTIPYGLNLNGTAWIDPAGTDITAGGVPHKSITIAAVDVAAEKGSVIDIRGGGDLYAYRFVPGLGGTKDVLSSASTFAILPGYLADYAPYAPYNPAPLTGNLGGDAGYVNTRLAVGDRIYLGASNGLPAGNYTLLPARYALLPGAFLISPQSGTPVGTVSLPDGSSLVSGYRFNNAQTGHPLMTRFEVSPASVVRGLAEYDDFFANTYLKAGAETNHATVPRLPKDAGQLVLAATRAMTIEGTISSQSLQGGHGGLVDISSPADILISGPKTNLTGLTNTLVLDSSELDAIGAESLLIGGLRQTTLDGEAITVRTNNITVDNAGASLSGSDLIIVANKALTLAAGADLKQTGQLSDPATKLFLGNSTSGSGDGTLLRVSSDPAAQITRTGLDASTVPNMTIGADVHITGVSVILDSTSGTSLDPGVTLQGQSISLNSGHISLELTDPGLLQPNPGLVLSSQILQGFQTGTKALSLLSYSSIDFYGIGQVGSLNSAGQPALDSLSLHAAEVRGFNANGGTVAFAARNIFLDNASNGASSGPVSSPGGTLSFHAETIQLGAQTLNIDQYTEVNWNAARGVLFQGLGSIRTQGNLTITTPLITGAKAAAQTITAGGAFTIATPADVSDSKVIGGLGATLALAGATLIDNGNIVLPSGALTLHATGDLLIGNLAVSRLDVAGTAQNFFDLVKYTDGGKITLLADLGSVVVAAGSTVTVAAETGGGNAGSLSLSAPQGSLTIAGALLGQGGAGGLGGTFSVDAATIGASTILQGNDLTSLEEILNAGGFTESQTIRVRGGFVQGVDYQDVFVAGATALSQVKAHSFTLSADQGSITVDGVIDASGVTGGTINLLAGGSVTLSSGAILTVAGQSFSDAGKGGAISLEAGSETNGSFNQSGFVDIQTGSLLDLSVASNTGDSAAAGDFTGTLHLRAPQTTANTDVQVKAMNGTIKNASSIVVEGYRIFDAGADGSIDNQEVAVSSNGTTFAGNTVAMTNALLANNVALAPVFHIQPGAEIINRTGDLALTSSWDLSTYRFGPNNEPGVLTLRAAGNLTFKFQASLSDGFGGPSNFDLWDALLLPPGTQSWSYRLVSGADFDAVDFRVADQAGSLLLGAGNPALPTSSTNDRASVISSYFQTIRTGSGNIDIYSGRDVQLLNPLATIYTAGSQASAMANFDTPRLDYSSSLLGVPQNPIYPAQYSMGGGHVAIQAQNDIARYVLDPNGTGNLIADSTKELPTSWLYRRDALATDGTSFSATRNGDIASTTWWIDFSNFLEGVGALGGGDVSLIAGHDVSNVDAAAPTNARMPIGTPEASRLSELGGGDITIRAGHDINGGTYYVERGKGTLSAGNTIHTNSTRAAISQDEFTQNQFSGVIAEQTKWLPTTLFVGKGSFEITTQGDLLMGPVANPFLLPQGINNGFFNKSYYSTYAASDAVTATSLTGSVTIKNNPDPGGGSLQDWYQNVLLQTTRTSYGAISQPWLRLADSQVSSYTLLTSLMPPTLQATAFSGDINLAGRITLTPSAMGNINLFAAQSINGVQATSFNDSTRRNVWTSSLVNLSDADPNRLPGVASPISSAALRPSATLFAAVNSLFNESGSTEGAFGVIQTQQSLHAPGLLHADDAEPVHLYARGGDISGTTLFAGKETRVMASQDITDVALYLQNDRSNDVAVISAGRDLVAYDPNSKLRQEAQSGSNELAFFSSGVFIPASGSPTAGDIQISGPGTLQVLTGRNLDLGVGPNNSDGTGVGLVSIGNARNPYLPFAGANIIAGTGLSGTGDLSQRQVDFKSFIAQFLSTGRPEAERYFAELDSALPLTPATFAQLPPEQQDEIALDLFYLILRDAGRDHNLLTSPGLGSYAAGFSAISALFPKSHGPGDISLTSREIKTKSGGNISLFAPGGGLAVGLQVAGTQPLDQGILTEDGGNISIFADQSIAVGTSRIFTLRGGNEIIWSSGGDIAAGASSKTVQSAPPTRVLIDPQSADVQTDLAGLATGGGIGVLDTVAGVPPGNVDLIAPVGSVDAGDAGIRVTGNLNIAAAFVLNASNIQAGGASVGVPTNTVAAPNLGALTSASNAAGAGNAAASDQAAAQRQNQAAPEQAPSIITVEVVGYGGGGG